MESAAKPGAWRAGGGGKLWHGVLRETEPGKGFDLRSKDLSDALTSPLAAKFQTGKRRQRQTLQTPKEVKMVLDPTCMAVVARSGLRETVVGIRRTYFSIKHTELLKEWMGYVRLLKVGLGFMSEPSGDGVATS